MKLDPIKNPIRATAITVVTIISAYIMVMGWRLTDILASPGWCAKAVAGEKLSGDSAKVDIAAACVGLLTIQLKATSTNSHVYAGALALVLLVLIVIVIAGGKLDLSAGKTGIHAGIGRDAVEGAQHVREAAQVAEAEVKEGTA